MRTSITGLHGAYFSVCGILYSGRRSSIVQSLETHACLKLNQKVSVCYGWVCFVRTEQCVCV